MKRLATNWGSAGLRLLGQSFATYTEPGVNYALPLAFFRGQSMLKGQMGLPTSNWVQSSSFNSSSYASQSVLDEEYTSSPNVMYPAPKVGLLKPAPDFTAPAVVDGKFKDITLSSYKGGYVLLFFYPKDFTYVCPTEIIAFSDRADEFARHNCTVMAISTDTEEVHLAWINTPRKHGGLGHMKIPIIADTTKKISSEYGVLNTKAGIAFRGLFIIDKEGVVQQITMNNFAIGRSVDEALRLIQAQQFYEANGEVCPANWQPGEEGMGSTPETSKAYFEQQQEFSEHQDIAPSLRSIKDASDFAATIGKGPVVVDFMAPWCGKCKMIGPFVEELAQKHPNVEFVKLDTTNEQLKDVVAGQNLQGLPVFKFFKNGAEIREPIVGYKKTPLHDAVAQIS